MNPSTRALCALVFVAAFMGCFDSRGEEVRIGTDEKADLVFVLKEGFGANAESAFLDSCLSVRDNPKPGQHTLRSGIQALARVRARGFAAYAVQFRSNTSAERRAQVKADCERAEIVESVHENVVPGEI